MGRWVLLLVLVPGVLGQVNDRRRVESDVYSLKLRIERDMEACPWKWGPVFSRPILGIGQLGYDSNVFSTEDERQDDFTVVPEIGLSSYWRMSPRFVFSSRGVYQYRYFRDADYLNGSEYDVSPAFHALFRRVTFSLGGHYGEDRVRTNSEIDFRARNVTTTGSAELVFQPFNRTFVELSGKSGRTEFKRNSLEEEILDASLSRDYTTLSSRMLFQLKPRFWPFFGMRRETYDFEQPTNPRNSTFTDGFMGFRSEYDSRLHFNVTLGMTRMEFPLAPEADDDVFTTTTYVRYNLSRLASVDADVRRTPLFSAFASYNYFISARYSVGYTYHLKGGWGFGPEIQFGTNDYAKPLDPNDPLREDQFSNVNLRIFIPSINATSFVLRMGYQKRDSNLPGLSDEGFQVDSTIRYAHR